MLPVDFDIFSSESCSIPLWAQKRANGLPAPRDWASSFSWCGKRRSRPPPWISNSGPRCFSAIAEHSMCQPGRPGPQGESHSVSSCAFVAFQRAKSRGSSFRSLGSWAIISSGCAPESEPYVGIGRHAEVDVAAGLVGEPAVDQLADESDDLRDDLGRARLDVRPAEPELVGVLDVPLRRLLGQLGAPHLLPRGRLVDLVVDVRDVLDELDLVARARRASAASTSRRRTAARSRCGSAGTRSGRRRTCGSGPAEPGARPSAASTSRRAAPRRYTGLPVSSC